MRRRTRANSAQASISMPSPAMTRKLQKMIVELGRSSLAKLFRAGICLSRLWVRIRLPRYGTSML
ncbi:hypothetical protein D3C77_753400 [compost metagenome]